MIKVESQVAGRKLTIETGSWAKQANGSCKVTYGDTVVLCAVTMGSAKSGDFMPLTVDYKEMAYAAGKIPGGFFKREGRPRDSEVLTSRIVDRSLRPLFPKGFIQEVLVSVRVLSHDMENKSDMLALIGSSAALLVSDIPFATPVAVCRVGLKDDAFIVNPTISEITECSMELIVAGTKTGITMIEGGGNEIMEDKVESAVAQAKPVLDGIIAMCEDLRSKAGKEKVEGIRRPEVAEDFKAKVTKEIEPKLLEAFKEKSHTKRGRSISEIKAAAAGKLNISDEDKGAYAEVFDGCIKDIFLKKIKVDKRRLDGRAFDEIRNISSEVSVLPRTHGSAVFTRGETQALAVTTLGSMSDKQIMDELEGDYKKRFMLHYNFPHFATGEVGFPRGPGRREIGHGYLAEKSIVPLLPPEEQFPYTVRVVSEILESNGSSSMASVCGSCLSLMDAGVPIRAMVAGIAMGIVDMGDEKVLLVDIAGEEDHLGNMDLKIAGTKKGITAVQMDLKMESLDVETFRKALALSKEARCKIIDKMSEALPESRVKVSQFAPQIDSVKIKVDKIGALIGPGGKNIKGIIADTGCEVNVDDSGLVQLAADSVESINAAKQMIEYLVGDVEVGKIHMGKVTKTVNFGAFVQIYPGTEGLVHVSELAPQRVNLVTDVAQEGDQLLVKVLSVDDKGKIRLSRKEALRDLKISDESQYGK